MKSGSNLSVPGSVLYREDVLVVLRRQMTIILSQGVSFGTKDVPENTGHVLGTLHGQNIQRKEREN